MKQVPLNRLAAALVLALALVPMALSAQAAKAAEKVPESIKTPTIWKTGSTYYLTGSTTVTATLTIQEGVVVKFARDASLSTTGSGLINAKGTQAAPVVFTAAADNSVGAVIKNVGDVERGYWGGVYLEDTNSSAFAWCTFSYGGYSSESPDMGLGYGVLYTGTKSVKIENCRFVHCNGYGIMAAHTPLALAIKSCTFDDVGRPMIVSPAVSVDQSHTFVSADQNAVFVSDASTGFNDSNTKGSLTTWMENRVPYVIAQSINVKQDHMLRIGPGVVVKFEAEMFLSFYGDGKANKNDNLKVGKGVVFTSIRNDLLGDTNMDQDASAPENADWDGLYSERLGLYVKAPGIVTFDKHQEDDTAVAFSFEAD